MATNWFKNKFSNVMNSPAEDISQMLLCLLCNKQLSEPITVLNCGHVTHTSCLWNYSKSRGQEVIEKTTEVIDYKANRTLQQLSCPVCGSITNLPPGGNIGNLSNRLSADNYVHSVKKRLLVKHVVTSQTVNNNQQHTNFLNIEYEPRGEDGESLDFPKSPAELRSPSLGYHSDYVLSPDMPHGPFSDFIIQRNKYIPEEEGGHIHSPDLKDCYFNIPRQSHNSAQSSQDHTTRDDNITSSLCGIAPGLAFIPETVNMVANSNYESSTSSTGTTADHDRVGYGSQLSFQSSGIGESPEILVKGGSSPRLATTTTEIAQICCRSHSKALCMMYCDSCSVPICDKCASRGDHKDHLIHGYNDITKQWLTHIENMKRDLKSILQSQMLWDTEVEALHERQKHSYREMRETVKRQTERVIEAIENQRDRFLKHLELHCKSQHVNYKRADNFIKYGIQASQDLQITLNKVCSADGPVSPTSLDHSKIAETYKQDGQALLAINFKPLQTRLKTHIEDSKYGEKYVQQLQKQLKFKTKETICDAIVSGPLKLGQLDFTTIDRKDLKPKSTVPMVPTSCTSPNTKRPSKNPTQLNSLPQVKWTHEDPPIVLKSGGKKNSSACGILFLENDCSLVAYDALHTISRFIGGKKDPGFRLVDKKNRSLSEEQIMPKCLTRMDDTTIAITDFRKFTLRLIGTDGVQKKMLRPEILRSQRKNTVDQPHGYSPSNPKGVTALPNQKLAVTDTMHNAVYILDPQTETILNKFGCYGKNNNQFNSPEFVTYDSTHNRILVSDCNNHAVKLYDVNGTFLGAFGEKNKGSRPVRFTDGSEAPEFSGLHQPTGLVCDLKGDILVVNAGHHSICRFDGVSSKFLSVVDIYKGHQRMLLSWPYGIDISKTGLLGITEQTTGRVTVVTAYT